MFVEDENVTENQAMAQLKFFRERYCENGDFERKEKNRWSRFI